ncbi:MAG: hypothetical protein COA54_09045 [Thiotrichaceae bacterium]|nr:MAG: hypothetical protein COA54_09045 [Thiotrichaceae bacterium]
MLQIAALLCLVIGIVHSYLGERYILIRLFRGDKVPHLFGSDFFTKGTLRFVWHIMTFAWWGFGYLLWQVSVGQENLTQTILYTVSTVSLLSALFSFGFTRGKHLSWVVFSVIAGITFYVAKNG